MNKTTVKPCAEWADRLAARHPDDLSPADAAALRQHLQTCTACASVYRSYALMESAIRALPVGEPLAALPQQSLLEEPVKGRLTAVGASENSTLTRWPRMITRRQRLVRFANLSAAVLVVGAIIVASVLLFGTHHPTTTGGKGPGPLMPPGSLPQMVDGCGYGFDPGVQQACLDHYLVPVNLSKQINGEQITIDHVYADATRVVILFHVVRLSNHTYLYPALLTNQSYSALPSRQSNVLPADGGESGPFATPKGAVESSLYFDTASVPTNTTALRVHFTITRMNFAHGGTASIAPLPAAIKGPLTFDFTVPFHATRRVVTLNQTITVNGKKVTLERVVIGFSRTLLYLNGINLIDQFSLSAGPWKNRGLGGGLTDNVSVNNAVTLTADLPLLTESGQWTLKITGNGGTWTIHFTIPPASGNS
mgnify:CR=1 FL=1